MNCPMCHKDDNHCENMRENDEATVYWWRCNNCGNLFEERKYYPIVHPIKVEKEEV